MAMAFGKEWGKRPDLEWYRNLLVSQEKANENKTNVESSDQ